MRMKSTIKGRGELQQSFRALDRAVSRAVMVSALSTSAEPMRATSAALAPRSDGKGPHLADNIVLAETRFGVKGAIDSSDVVAVAIGPSHRPHDMFYGFFQERGTARHPAHPFLRPAFDSERRGVMKRIGGLIWAALKRVGGR